MKKYFKLFQNINQEILPIEYSEIDQRNYFNFVKTQYQKKLRQVIITSEIMLHILEKYFVEYNFRIINIYFAEGDIELEEKLQEVLERLEENRGYFLKLLKELECIADNSSIDIESIELKSLNKKDGKYLNFRIWVNGILSIEKGQENYLLEEITNLVKEKL